MKGIIASRCWNRRSSLLWTKISYMNTIWNDKIKYSNNDEQKSQDELQSSHEIVLTVAGLLVELSTAIEKPKGSIEAYNSIMWPYVTGTFNSPVIYPSLFSSFFFGSILRTNIRLRQNRGWHRNIIESEVRNSAALCGTRIKTVKKNGTMSGKCLSNVDLNKERYIFY